jgi:2-oxoglutarate ferredoxin oxidoreductase subunit beta
MTQLFDLQPEISWCPGCGNFAIRKIMLEVLKEIEMERQEVIFVSGIGQAAKAPQFYNASYFNGLHGRSLPSATGIKVAQPETHVIVESGDGDMYELTIQVMTNSFIYPTTAPDIMAGRYNQMH